MGIPQSNPGIHLPDCLLTVPFRVFQWVKGSCKHVPGRSSVVLRKYHLPLIVVGISFRPTRTANIRLARQATEHSEYAPMSLGRVLLCILLPPLAILDKGCGSILIVTILTLLGWIPGCLAALVICMGDKNSGGNTGGTGQPQKVGILGAIGAILLLCVGAAILIPNITSMQKPGVSANTSTPAQTPSTPTTVIPETKVASTPNPAATPVPTSAEAPSRATAPSPVPTPYVSKVTLVVEKWIYTSNGEKKKISALTEARVIAHSGNTMTLEVDGETFNAKQSDVKPEQ